jgi:hypothetical protein
MDRVVVLLLVGLLAWPVGAASEPADDWRAGAGVLVERVERLARGGEVDAAAAVMRELLKRDKIGEHGLDDRARMALAQAYLAADRRAEALAEIKAIPWADKSPKLAADIVALELAIRWQGLRDKQNGDRLVSGAIPAVNSPEAPGGRGEGVWRARWEDFQALRDLMNRGARMVRAEGGTVILPATPAMLALARYGRGDLERASLVRELGKEGQWDASLALAVALLHFSESEIDEAAAASEELWQRFPATSEAQTAFRQFRTWQKHRGLAGQTIRLWSYPEIDRRLDALSTTYAGVEAEVQKSMASLQDLNEIRMRADLVRSIMGMATQATALAVAPLEDFRAGAHDRLPVAAQRSASGTDPAQAEYRLALDYEGLQVRVTAVQVPAGVPASLTIHSMHRGEHLLRLYRLPDFARWQEFGRAPERGLLPVAPVADRTLNVSEWRTLGQQVQTPADFKDLAEGYYVATVTARGSPVVAFVGFMVVASDLRLVAGRDSALGWVVRRADGKARQGEPVKIELTLARNAVDAGGRVYAGADPAWQAGFREGFLGVAEEAFRMSAQEQTFQEGLRAGHHAAERDPAFCEMRRVASDLHGLVRFDLPERIRGRSYEVKANIDRPEVRVESYATYGADAHWTRKAVVWADKPFARPGETVHYKAVLRDFNGEMLRRPVGTVQACVQLGELILKESPLAVSDTGAVWGEIVLPPGCEPGALTLKLDDGPAHALARVDRTELPLLRCEFVDMDVDRVVRCGESTVFRLRLTDAGGEPVPDLEVRCSVSVVAGSLAPPCEQPPVAKSDMAGEVEFRIPTLAATEAHYQLCFGLQFANQAFRYYRSFRTQIFPFRLDVEVPDATVEVGETLRVLCRLPDKASVTLQLASLPSLASGAEGQGPLSRPDFRGTPVEVRGQGEAWVETAMPLRREHSGADFLRVSTPTLDGKIAERWIPIVVKPVPELGTGRGVELALLRRYVKPDGAMPLTIGVRSPGRDVLLVGATRNLSVARVERLDEPTKRLDLKVDESWSPNLFLEATAYLPGQGFVTTERQEAQVLPVQRMLKVDVRPEREGYRPGDTVHAAVRVFDWKERPVTNCSVSLGVVNALVYQLHQDSTPDLWAYFHNYHRKWDLQVGAAPVLSQPSGILWRSLLWQWQTGGAPMLYSSRCAGGRQGALGLYGKGGGAARLPPLLKPGEDSTVTWVADLRTDEKGEAVVTFTLPAGAARFRCTARANDASANVLVGEVRTEIAAALPYRCELVVPKFVRPGDQFTAFVQVFNYREQEANLVLTGPNGVRQELGVAPHGRRRVPLRLTAPTVAGPIVRVGQWLGSLANLRVVLRGTGEDAPAVQAEADTLVLCPGLGVASSFRLVVGADGAARMPLPVAPGAAVSLRLRSWPDAAARRKSELDDWLKMTAGPRAGMAWLLAPEGKERREKLAAIWPTLGTDLASCWVKLAAIRRGESAGAVDNLPEGLAGDWVAARGRAFGVNLRAPRSRGQHPESLLDRVLVCAIALAEGWAEGTPQWHELRRELRRAEPVGAEVAAFAADAARLAQDHETFPWLVARLGQDEWTNPEVAVLAAELIPAASVTKPAEVVIQGPAEAVRLKTEAFAEWCGVVKTGLCLAATPGALLAVETLIQQPYAAPAPAVRRPKITWWQSTETGYQPMSADQPVWPGRPHLLVVDGRDVPEGCEVVLGLPPLLTGFDQEADVECVASNRTIYGLSEEQRERLQACVDGYAADVVRGAKLSLRNLDARNQPMGERVPVVRYAERSAGANDLWTASWDRQLGIVRVTLQGGARVAIPVLAMNEGECAVAGALVASQADDLRQLPGTRMRVAVDQPAGPVQPRPDPGLAAALGRKLDDANPVEIAWILRNASGLHAEEEWRNWLAVLDPGRKASLDQLLSHPRCGERGHWTTKALRAWVDGEPLLMASREEVVRRIGVEGPYTLAQVAKLAAAARADRQQAWSRLPMPQSEPLGKPVSLERWCRRLMELGLLPRVELEPWLWNQTLGAEVLRDFGYEATILSWVEFLRQELGIKVALADAVPVWEFVRVLDESSSSSRGVVVRKSKLAVFVGGANLGTASFAQNNLGVFQTPKGYSLRRLEAKTPQATVCAAFNQVVIDTITFDHVTVQEALEFVMKKAGVAVRFVGLPDDLPRVTFEARHVSVQDALKIITEVAGVSYVVMDNGVEVTPVKRRVEEGQGKGSDPFSL